MTKYVCIDCGYIYDPAKGDERRGIAVGTSFASLPDFWRCPVCDVAKSDFAPW
ncbi:MAG: rubredoxin [Nitrospirae bacterium]|nr:rubredoxin [Nitrospirota bacterium]